MPIKTSYEAISKWGAIAACLGGLSIAVGAFAAHGLKSILSPYQLGIIETGASYQMYHALALLCIAGLAQWGIDDAKFAQRCEYVCSVMLLGVILFSGSLYALALTGLSFLGFLTPLGGLCLLFSWFLLAYACFKIRVTV